MNSIIRLAMDEVFGVGGERGQGRIRNELDLGAQVIGIPRTNPQVIRQESRDNLLVLESSAVASSSTQGR